MKTIRIQIISQPEKSLQKSQRQRPTNFSLSQFQRENVFGNPRQAGASQFQREITCRNLRQIEVCRTFSRRIISCLLACLLIGSLLSAVGAKAQTIEIKPQPFLEQCQTLRTGGGNDEVARAIVALRSKDVQERAKAAQRLGQSCDSRAVEPLTEALKDEEANVRVAAVSALGKLGDKESVEMLIELITDKDHRVRMALISALASFKTFRPRNFVLNGIAFTSGPDPDNEADLRVRCAAILTCNQMTDNSFSRKAIMFLYNFLHGQYPRARALAEQTMMELKNTRNGPTELMGIAKNDNNPILRRWATLWLGKLKLEAARELLQNAAANDVDAFVRQAAVEALKQLDAK
jgi:hypothetical protein